jgi:hypothetical protein
MWFIRLLRRLRELPGGRECGRLQLQYKLIVFAQIGRFVGSGILPAVMFGKREMICTRMTWLAAVSEENAMELTALEVEVGNPANPEVMESRQQS